MIHRRIWRSLKVRVRERERERESEGEGGEEEGGGEKEGGSCRGRESRVGVFRRRVRGNWRGELFYDLFL